MMVQGLIFDFDGVIIDTDSPQYELWRDVYLQANLDLSLDLWVKRLGAADSRAAFDPVSHYQSLTGRVLDQAFLYTHRQQTIERCMQQPVLPGVVDLIQVAHQRGIKLAVASNANRWWITQHLQRLGLDDYFAYLSTLEDVMMGKPAPDVYLNAAAGLGLAPDQCLALEDSPTGMTAALIAGIRVVAVLTPLTSRLPRPEVSWVLSSLAAVDPAAFLECF